MCVYIYIYVVRLLVWIISNYEFLGRGQENMLVENGGKINNFTIICRTCTTEEKEELVKDSFYDKLNHLYQRIPARYENYGGRL